MLIEMTAGKVRNFEILTKDAVSRLGVWHILPQSIYAAYLDERGYAIEGLDDSVFDQALKTRETCVGETCFSLLVADSFAECFTFMETPLLEHPVIE